MPSPDFDAAQDAQFIVSMEAEYAKLSGQILPQPPFGFAALRNRIGANDLEGYEVMGYSVGAPEIIRERYFRGELRLPGDELFANARTAFEGNFLDLMIREMLKQPVPNTWTIKERTGIFLYAHPKGNAVMCEGWAREAGYDRAFAVGPNRVRLCELH